MLSSPLCHVASQRWDLADLPRERRDGLLDILEQGGVLHFDGLPDPVAPDVLAGLLDASHSDPRRKNISFDAAGRGLQGARAGADVQAGMVELLVRYQEQAAALVLAIAPAYQGALRMAPSSLRVVEAHGRPASWRKDDSRLHIDAFPSRPNYGERILRVFRNVNPSGGARVWRVGEPFAQMAQRFMGRLPPYRAWRARALNAIGVTKRLRGEYDHLMLALHDAMKADTAYQAECPQETVPFAPGATWVCFSDQVSHAVMSGQFMLEQTLHLPVAAMQQSSRSPLRVLESLYGRPLA